MADDTRRIDGTLFWLGQYTVRNKRFIELFDKYHHARERVTQDDAASLGADLEILRDRVEDMTAGLGTDKEIALHRAWFNEISANSESAALTVERIKTIVEEAYAAVRELDSDFPCTRGVYAGPEEPYEILQSVLTGNFPPNDDKSGYDEAMVPPVLHNGKDMFGRTVLTIDHTADMGRILEGVQRILKAGSGLQDDFPSLIPAIGKRLARKYRQSDESRAIGLILYDYRNEFTCSDAEYVRKIRAALKKDLRKKGLRSGKEDSGQRQYEDWLARTKECIEKAEVLDI